MGYYTFQDAVEHLWDQMQPGTRPPIGRELRQAKRAVIAAYLRLPSEHQWRYYKRRIIIKTDARYATGTISYDHTGGSSERLVTLSGGTFPENLAYGVLYFNGAHYRVSERLSDTTCTLDSDTNPGEDVSSTSYVWYRDTYPLPTTFISAGEVIDTNGGNALTLLNHVDPSSQLWMNRTQSASTTRAYPGWYTIRASDDYPNRMVIVFGPFPTHERTYECICTIGPRLLKVYKESAGTVTTSGTSLTGTNTAFSSDHVGSIIRLSNSTIEPTSIIGNADGALNPYTEELVIKSVTDESNAVLETASSGLSGVAYTISDPIDVDRYSMLTYFQRSMEYEYAVLTKREDSHQRNQRMRTALVQAMSADYRSTAIETAMVSGGPSYSRLGEVSTTP